MTFKSFREESRANWGRDLNPGERLNRDEIQHGALLRIADACELMAKERERMERELKFLREQRDYWQGQAKREKGSNVALRGVITRMKRAREVQS